MSEGSEKSQGKTAADRLVLKISSSPGRRDKVKNSQTAWPTLIAKLSEPAVDNITRKQFDKLPVMEQIKRKNRGYFVGGHFVDGERKITNISKRQVLTLDCDRMTVEQFDMLTENIFGDGALGEFEYFAYTTRSHRPESPRLRIVVPLLSEIDLDAFQAASRILSSRLDATMDLVDPVSHRPAQIMYYPSRCSDDEFKCYRHRGRIMDATADVLDTFEDDWRDWKALPRGERDNMRPTGGKAEHPLQKRGLVGAYCRARDVFAQLFSMPELYEPSEQGPTPTRWSYKKGHSRDGVIVYPEDQRIHSHHSTDPCADQNLTTFDYERIHRFGDLDKGENEHGDTPPQDMPSYKALITAIQDDDSYSDVRHEHAAMQYDQEMMAHDAAFDEDLEDEPEQAELEATPGAITHEAKEEAHAAAPAPARKAGTDAPEVTSVPRSDELLELLDLTEKGGVRKTYNNLVLILTHDSRFKGAFRFNEFIGKPVIVRQIGSKSLGTKSLRVSNKGNGDEIGDGVRAVVRMILSAPNRDGQAGWGVEYSLPDIAAAIEQIAQQNRFHPVRKYLNAVRWDGVPRVANILRDYFHVGDHVYFRETSELMMVGAVARIFEPGCKFDYMPILEGWTGAGKSTAVRDLVPQPEWFGIMMADLSKPERVVESYRNKWLVEMDELASFTKAESNIMKSITTAGTITTRLAYRRDEERFPFQFIFIGTTNDRDYLKDPTGNRRYLPIRVPDGVPIDNKGILRDRDQLWAEAYQLYLWHRRVTKHGDLPLRLSAAAEQRASVLRDDRMVVTEGEGWKALIEEWLNTETTEMAAQGHLDRSVDDLGLTEEPRKSLPERMCVSTVAYYVFNTHPSKVTKTVANGIAKALDSIPTLHRSDSTVRFKGFGKLRAWVRDEL